MSEIVFSSVFDMDEMCQAVLPKNSGPVQSVVVDLITRGIFKYVDGKLMML